MTVRAIVVVAGLVLLPAPGRAQEMTVDEAQRAAPYYRYWELADATPPAPAEVQTRLRAAIREAEREFGGRGPALAQYFLRHMQASPGNTAFFFLFRAVGDVETARVLIKGLLDPPPIEGQGYGRDAGEIGVGLEALLKNDAVSVDPAVVAAMQDTLARARQRPEGGRVATTIVSLLGACRTPEATRLLESLASDADASIRFAAVSALGNRPSPSAGLTLQRSLTGDADPEARARAAESLARNASPEAAASLRASLTRETSPQVIDAIVRALTTLGALPQEPQPCLDMANRCWDVSVAQPLFACWRRAASRDELIDLATSGGWTARVLALQSLAGVSESQRIQAAEPRLVMPAPPAAGGAAGRSGALPLMQRPAPDFSPAVLDPALRDRLLQSAVEVLSRRTSAMPLPDTLSYSTAQVARDAFWNISGRDMPVALGFADRIVPVSGRHASAGSFGESADLASKDRVAYVRTRRPRQLIVAAVAAVAISPLLAVGRFRKLSLALILALGLWALWFSFQGDARELPPLRLAFLTVSCLAFLTAGLTAGSLTLLRTRRWLRVIAAPIVAGVGAFLVCGVTRWGGWFPVGSEGWELIFEPAACAILAAPAALLLSLGLELLPSPDRP